jgi:rubrerythrin
METPRARRTLAQAVRDAIEAERAAERFYRGVAEGAAEAVARRFLLNLAEEERAHAEKIARNAPVPPAGATDTFEAPPELEASGPTPELELVDLVETAPGWRHADDVAMGQALELAIEGEDHAHLYYAALADSCQGALARFFDEMAKEEEAHAARLREMLHQLSGR